MAGGRRFKSQRVLESLSYISQADGWGGEVITRRRRREEATAHPVQHRTEHSPSKPGLCPVAANVEHVEPGLVPLIFT